jgi:hypothetical protein
MKYILTHCILAKCKAKRIYRTMILVSEQTDYFLKINLSQDDTLFSYGKCKGCGVQNIHSFRNGHTLYPMVLVS